MSERLLHDPTTGFHDLKPLPGPARSHWSPLVGVAIVAGLLLLLVFVRMRKRHVPKRSPRDFLQELETLSGQIEREAKPRREIASELSLLLREYLEERAKIEAVERTRRELQSELARCSLLSEPEKRLVSEIVTACELIAFGDRPVTEELLPYAQKARGLMAGGSQ